MTDHIGRSIELKNCGDLKAALAELEMALQHGQDPPRAHYQRGLTLAASGLMDEAIAAYKAAISLRPDYAKALVNLAALLLGRQDTVAATALLTRAAPLVGDDDPVFLVNRAWLHRLTGKPGPAIRDAERATKAAPDEPGAWQELGICYLLDPRRTADSIAASRRALELDPANATSAHNLAAALDRAGEHAEALDYATRALEATPENLTFMQTKACVLLHLDRADEAMPLLEEVERNRPDHFEAQYNLACGLARSGGGERAIPHLRRAIELVPPAHRSAFLAHLPNDPDLAALRLLPAFRELLA